MLDDRRPACRRDDRAPRVMDAPDDLVLGYATGYDAAMMAPFVRSLRAVFDGPAAGKSPRLL